jgi:hypothetical protein
MDVAFKRITCYNCDLTAIYKFRVQQVRRREEIMATEEEIVRDDHVQAWKTVPRFAEIPETIKCKRCNEVLGVYPFCIF